MHEVIIHEHTRGEYRLHIIEYIWLSQVSFVRVGNFVSTFFILGLILVNLCILKNIMYFNDISIAVLWILYIDYLSFSYNWRYVRTIYPSNWDWHNWKIAFHLKTKITKKKHNMRRYLVTWIFWFSFISSFLKLTEVIAVKNYWYLSDWNIMLSSTTSWAEHSFFFI